MPDWITHFFISSSIVLLFRIKRRPVLIGALLPDIFKFFIPITILLNVDSLALTNLLAPFHTLAGTLFSALFFSAFFWDWKNAYLPMAIGASSHFILDLLLYPWGNEVWTFWPIWEGELMTGIFWPGSFYLPLISLLLFSIVYGVTHTLNVRKYH